MLAASTTGCSRGAQIPQGFDPSCLRLEAFDILNGTHAFVDFVRLHVLHLHRVVDYNGPAVEPTPFAELVLIKLWVWQVIWLCITVGKFI